jgi:preprotein translocase subunit SecE
MERINVFIRESYSELMTKVTWPTWDELQSSATIVTIAGVIISVIVFGMDAVSNILSSTYYSLFS